MKAKVTLSAVILCVVASTASFTSCARAVENQPNVTQETHNKRENFAKSFAQTALSIMFDQKKSYADRKIVLRDAFSKSVDIDWIGKFVLGKNWSNANDSKRQEYSTLYRRYLTESYVSNFAENPEKRIQDIKIINVNDIDEQDFKVITEMRLANSQIVKVNYLVREREGRYKVLDIVIENVSLISTHRAEFAALAANKGIDGVIEKLEAALKQTGTIYTLSMN